MTQALYRKWRPQKWDEVVGQPHIVQTLKNAVTGGHVAHAYLLAGPRGTGKTTAARLIAKAVNCLADDPAQRPCNQCDNCKAVNESRFLDLIEIDAASQTGVDDVRDLRDKINFSPNVGKYKIYIIDEVHMFSNSAFNALLKTLEEPPPHAIFILATTEINKIPLTVLSRCQRHEFRRLAVDDIVKQLRGIVKTEKLEAEEEALTLIGRHSAGGMRDAISLLDQLASTGQRISLELTQSVLGTATSQTVLALIEAVRQNNPAAGMDAIHAALDAGTDVRQLARQVVEYLRCLLLMQMGNGSQADLAGDVRKAAEKHAGAFQTSALVRMIKVFNAAAADPRGGWQPSLPLEMALAEVLEVNQAGEAQGDTPPVKKAARESNAAAGSSQPGGDNPPVEKGSSASALGEVAKSWKKVSESVRKNPSLNALLNSAKVLDLKKNVLTLGFLSDILRNKAQNPENLKAIHEAIQNVLGMDLEIKCVISNAKQTAPPDVKADGMVAAALKAGGEIVDIQK